MKSEQLALTGWGRTTPSVASLVDISADELTQTGVLERLDQSGRGVIARGMGRSYGDPAQNGGGTVIRISDGDIAVNSAQGSVRVGAGISLDTLLRECLRLQRTSKKRSHLARLQA